MRTRLLLFSALGLVSCSSGYVPAKSPRITTVMSGGSVALYKDGKEYPTGLFLSGVEDAVMGNARAESEARTASSLMIGGWVCELAGLGALAGGIGLAASSHPDDSENKVGLGLVIGSVVTDLAAIILLLNATPHMYDAINIYNDGLAPVPYAPGPYMPVPVAPAPYMPAPAAPTPYPPAPVAPAPYAPATPGAVAPVTR